MNNFWNFYFFMNIDIFVTSPRTVFRGSGGLKLNKIDFWDHHLVDLDEIYLVQILKSFYLIKTMFELKSHSQVFYLVAEQSNLYRRSPSDSKTEKRATLHMKNFIFHLTTWHKDGRWKIAKNQDFDFLRPKRTKKFPRPFKTLFHWTSITLPAANFAALRINFEKSLSQDPKLTKRSRAPPASDLPIPVLLF